MVIDKMTCMDASAQIMKVINDHFISFLLPMLL
jgi:hypothetical protein